MTPATATAAQRAQAGEAPGQDAERSDESPEIASETGGVPRQAPKAMGGLPLGETPHPLGSGSDDAQNNSWTPAKSGQASGREYDSPGELDRGDR